MEETQTKELRRQAKRRLTSEVEQVMIHSESEMLQWQGTTIDLMEAVYIAFTNCQIQDMEGNYLSFIDITRRVCSILHTTLPRNPYEVAARGSRRKGLQKRPFFDRYVSKIMRQPDCCPLWEKICNSLRHPM